MALNAILFCSYRCRVGRTACRTASTASRPTVRRMRGIDSYPPGTGVPSIVTEVPRRRPCDTGATDTASLPDDADDASTPTTTSCLPLRSDTADEDTLAAEGSDTGFKRLRLCV